MVISTSLWDNRVVADTSTQPPFRPQRTLRTTEDQRSPADFFAIYCRECGEFDRDYAGKYDEDLNLSIIFVGGPTSIVDTEYSIQRHARRSVLCS